MATSSRPAEALPPGGTIAVAMSGGVDSSVAAALCVAAGYRVFGIMLRLWAEDGAAGANKCCTAGAIDDARAVAEHPNRLDLRVVVGVTRDGLSHGVARVRGENGDLLSGADLVPALASALAHTLE